jgi:gluconate:H+ symporter, GntP family
MTIALLLLSILIIVVGTVKFEIHPFLVLLMVAILYGLASGMSFELLIQSINEGFGTTLGKIGIVIILGVIIGSFLEHTGGAYKIAEKVLSLTGPKNISWGMASLGWLISIPVFVDSAFIIMTPLNKALTKKAGLSITVTTVAMAMGMFASHSLVPPTPGPVAAAGLLNADLGFVMIGGLIISLLAIIPVVLFAKIYASKIYIDPNPEIDESSIRLKMKDAPTVWKSSLPIVIPIFLIVLNSTYPYTGIAIGEYTTKVLAFLGTPMIALLIGLLLAFFLPKKLEKHMISEKGWIGKSLKDAALILMITGAGGVFGKVLQNSGVADSLGSQLSLLNIGIWLPFIIAAALKTAQGSSTVAMITTASIIAPMMTQLGFDSEIAKALVVLSIGAGGCVVSHANDSFFWVVTQMTGMDISQGYRLHTAASAILGVSAAILIFISYSITA